MGLLGLRTLLFDLVTAVRRGTNPDETTRTRARRVLDVQYLNPPATPGGEWTLRFVTAAQPGGTPDTRVFRVTVTEEKPDAGPPR